MRQRLRERRTNHFPAVLSNDEISQGLFQKCSRGSECFFLCLYFNADHGNLVIRQFAHNLQVALVGISAKEFH